MRAAEIMAAVVHERMTPGEALAALAHGWDAEADRRRDAEHAAARMAVEVAELRARNTELENLVWVYETELNEAELDADAELVELDGDGEGATP